MTNLNFILSGRSDSGLTQIWQVESAHTGIDLGKISWYAPWRRYVFHPAPALFDSTCLIEIVKFLDDQMAMRTQDRQLR
jgi:hypothetical protein